MDHSYNPPHVWTLLIIINFTCLINLALTDSVFDACAPKSCGNGPMIRYPFWITHDQEFCCGYPHFNITCNGKNPIFRISTRDFIVKNISYTDHQFVVVSTAVYEDKCLAPLHNYYFDGTPFHSSPDNFNLSFFYNCSSAPKDYPSYNVECAHNSSHHSFAVFHKEALEQVHFSLQKCQSLVDIPVYINNPIGFTRLMKMKYTEILKMGFLLNWTAPDCSHCERSGGRCGFHDNQFFCFCRDKPQFGSCNDGNPLNLKTKFIIGLSSSLGSAIILCAIFVFYLRHHKKQHTQSSTHFQNISADSSLKDPEMGSKHLGVHLFSYGELGEATDNFHSSRELGDGGFGTVYYGKLRDGRRVAVKRLYENNCRRVELFMNEVQILARLRHPNLVSLYGCTSRHSRELLLVYEYIPNGTVADHLHGERAKPGSLPWPIRMNIAIETAKGLAYLHASDIIHRDVKTTNILLDQNFCVKVADFGLSRLFPNNVSHVSTCPQGTPGYVDPEYKECYQLTDKSDVYSFGVVLVELISSKAAVDLTRHRHEINLANMAINKIQNRALHELVDPCLGFESDCKVRKMISAMAELAFECLQSMKDLRPSMGEVLESLQNIRCDDLRKEKAEVMHISISEDDAVLLKHEPPPLSPGSHFTTPNASG